MVHPAGPQPPRSERTRQGRSHPDRDEPGRAERHLGQPAGGRGGADEAEPAKHPQGSDGLDDRAVSAARPAEFAPPTTAEKDDTTGGIVAGVRANLTTSSGKVYPTRT
jgi:hypothetical protein